MRKIYGKFAIQSHASIILEFFSLLCVEIIFKMI